MGVSLVVVRSSACLYITLRTCRCRFYADRCVMKFFGTVQTSLLALVMRHIFKIGLFCTALFSTPGTKQLKMRATISFYFCALHV